MVGCSQAELSMEFQTDVSKGEEYRSGCIIFRQDRGPHKCGGGGGGKNRDRCLHKELIESIDHP